MAEVLLAPTVLIVHNEALSRVPTEVIASAGYRVLEASSGDEALRLLAALPAPPDALLLDLDGPGLDGRAFLEQLVASGRVPGERLVVLAEAPSSIDHVRVLPAGSTGLEVLRIVDAVTDPS